MGNCGMLLLLLLTVWLGNAAEVNQSEEYVYLGHVRRIRQDPTASTEGGATAAATADPGGAEEGTTMGNGTEDTMVTDMTKKPERDEVPSNDSEKPQSPTDESKSTEEPPLDFPTQFPGPDPKPDIDPVPDPGTNPDETTMAPKSGGPHSASVEFWLLTMTILPSIMLSM